MTTNRLPIILPPTRRTTNATSSSTSNGIEYSTGTTFTEFNDSITCYATFNREYTNQKQK
jgi:hypothetical protein